MWHVQKCSFHWINDIWIKYLIGNGRYSGRSLYAIFYYPSWNSVSLTSRTKAKPRQNQHKQTNKKKTKTLLNSATAVKQSNHQEEFGSAPQATLTGRFPPHSYSAPPHMARVEDGEPWFEFACCCQFVSQSECYLNAVWGFLGQWIIL